VITSPRRNPLQNERARVRSRAMWAKRPALHSSEPGKPRRFAYAPRAGARSRAIRGWTFQSVFSGSAMRLWRFPGSCVPRFVDAHTRSRGSAPLATAAYAHQKCVKNGSPKGAKDTPRRTAPLSAVRSTLNVSPAAALAFAAESLSVITTS
jgi:hypothetical protein